MPRSSLLRQLFVAVCATLAVVVGALVATSLRSQPAESKLPVWGPVNGHDMATVRADGTLRPNIKLVVTCKNTKVAELLVQGDRTAINKAVKVSIGNRVHGRCDITFAVAADVRVLVVTTDFWKHVHTRLEPAGVRSFAIRPVAGSSVCVLLQYSALLPGEDLPQVGIPVPPLSEDDIFGA